jgi:alpha/beta superfamily hydrolase
MTLSQDASDYLGETLAVTAEPGLVLQATVGYRDDTPLDRMLVIFPPHPSLGGDSANNVVAALFRQAVAMRVLAVTFDYRGVREGSVHGTHVLTYWDRLEAAKDYSPLCHDAVQVIRRVRESFNPQAALWFAAYSFGNVVALATARELEVRGIAGISPPVFEYDVRPLLTDRPLPIFWLAPGDPFCPAGALDGLGGGRLPVREFPSEDHFFRGAETALARRVLEELLGEPCWPAGEMLPDLEV